MVPPPAPPIPWIILEATGGVGKSQKLWENVMEAIVKMEKDKDRERPE